MGGLVSSIGKAIGSIASTVGSVVSSAVSGFSTGNFLTGIAISIVGGLLAPKRRIPNSSTQQSANDSQMNSRTVMAKSPITSRETVYGESKKSGSIIFMEATNNNKFIHLVVQIASHEIQSFDTIYFNDEALTLTAQPLSGTDARGFTRFVPTSPTKYAKSSDVNPLQTKVRIKQHLGGDNQLADADLQGEVAKWTSAHRLRGIAYLYIRMEYDADMFPNGIPNISAEIKGKKLFDFRDSSTAFSKNPALALYDYLSDTRIGLGVSTSDIDTTSFTSIANICDQNITLSAGGTEKKYECHGVVYSDISPMEIINDLLSSFAGVLTYSNGKFVLKGGAFSSPSITLNESDFIGGFNLLTKTSRKDLFNTVKGIFTSDETNWQPSDYPPVTSTTFSDADGETITADVNLPFTKSSSMAQRIAKITLFKNRQQMILSARLRLTAFTLQVGDTVQINNTRFGFSNKVFEVADWTFVGESEEIGIDVILKETSSSVYDWNAEETSFLLDNTTLPTAQDVSPPSIVVTDELRLYAETPITVMKVVCSSSQGTTNEFEVEAQNTNEAGSDFITLGRSKGSVFELVNAEDGSIYNVRARSINAFNVHSSFITTTHEVVGKTAPPDDVTNFSSNVVGDIVHLNWTPVSNLDLSHYIIRHSPLTTSQKFQEGLIVAKKIGKPANTITLPAQTGTYMIKAIDVLGLESENSAKTVIIKNAISRDFNAVTSSTQSPNFTGGTMGTDLEVVTRDTVKYLQLIEGVLFDDASGNFDDMTGNFDSGGTATFNSEGVYDFPIFNLGGIYNSRVTFTCKFNRFDTASLFDSILGLFDSQTGNFEGGYTEHNDVNVELLIATSTDGTNYNDYRNYVLGDYTASHIKLRVKLTCDVDTVTPAIYELSASVDMPDRTTAEDDVASGTASGGKAVTFSPAFKELQGLGISAQSLATGDFYELTSKSATGFTIKFKNSSGSVVNRSFDYVAKGYGYVESA
tara:strand:- start:1603 stop:4536 length:2934 start_codon:yes stop_codon:yes gene_type:complete